MLDESVMKRSLIGVGVTLALGVGFVVACIPHPSEDYADFLERTADYRKKPPVDDSGPADGQAPTQVVEGIYYGSCLSALSVGDLNKVLRFYAEVRFVPGTGGGKLDIQFTPLKGVDFSSGQPVPSPPATVAKSETHGDSFGQKGADVSATGRFEVGFEKVVIDKNANPISGREILIDNVFFRGLFSAGAGLPEPEVDAAAPAPDAAPIADGGAPPAPADAGPTPTPGDAGSAGNARFCATLQGTVTVPIKQFLDPAENFCVFVPVKEGDPVPEVKREEYKCKL